MHLDGDEYCYVEKDNKTLRVHKSDFYSNPACGTKVDPRELDYTSNDPRPIDGIVSKEDIKDNNLCMKCFKNEISVLHKLAEI